MAWLRGRNSAQSLDAVDIKVPLDLSWIVLLLGGDLEVLSCPYGIKKTLMQLVCSFIGYKTDVQ